MDFPTWDQTCHLLCLLKRQADSLAPCHLAKVKVLVAHLRIVARQDPLPMGFSRRGYWSSLPFPLPGNLPITPGLNPGLLHFRQILYHLGLPWWLRGKASACSAGDLGSIPGSGRCPGLLQSMGSQRVEHDWVTSLSFFTVWATMEGLRATWEAFYM